MVRQCSIHLPISKGRIPTRICYWMSHQTAPFHWQNSSRVRVLVPWPALVAAQYTQILSATDGTCIRTSLFSVRGSFFVTLVSTFVVVFFICLQRDRSFCSIWGWMDAFFPTVTWGCYWYRKGIWFCLPFVIVQTNKRLLLCSSKKWKEEWRLFDSYCPFLLW